MQGDHFHSPKNACGRLVSSNGAYQSLGGCFLGKKAPAVGWLAVTWLVKSWVAISLMKRNDRASGGGYPCRGGANNPAEGQAASTWVSCDHGGQPRWGGLTRTQDVPISECIGLDNHVGTCPGLDVRIEHSPGMFRARPRWAVSASDLGVPDRAGTAPPTPCTSISQARPAQHLTGPGPARPPTLTFTNRARGSPAPNHSLLSTGPGPARPQPLTFIDRAQASPAPTLLLLARPLTSICQTPHFYWPDPSLLLAGYLTSISQTPHI